jgi:hypothetical protein
MLGQARRSTGAVVAAIWACVALAGAGQAKTPDLIAHHKVLKTTCETTAKGNIRAKVTVRMTVVNYDGLGGDWAQRMKAQARLVPATGAGLSYFRDWTKVRTGVLLTNHRYNHALTLLTNSVHPGASWRVQLKLIWDRPVRSDVIKELSLPISAPCAGIGTF